MVTCAQYSDNYRNHHSLKVTATILSHLATHTIPTIPGRHTIKPTRLPGIRSLFTANAAQVVAAVLPPLQCAVGLINLGSPLSSTENQSLATTPTKAAVTGSPISPSMTPSSPLCQGGSSSATYQTISPKIRRPLSLHDLLSSETPTSPSTQQCKNVHHRRQCGIADCHKYALTGGFCIRHGGGKRCNFDGCQTVAQSGGRCKAHGGGSKCKVSGCGSVARRKGFCMMHGGRQQCKIDGCSKCAHGGGFCISHGGGKRCSSKGCNKSAQAGGFCYSHGGGKRCAAPECFQAARKGGLCIRHRKAATVLHRTLHPSLARLTSVTGRSQHERRLSRLYYSSQSPHGSVAQDHGTNESPGSSVSPRRLVAGNPPPDAPLALWQIADSPLYWDENDGLSLLPESALETDTACQDHVLDKLRERRDLDVQKGEKEKEDVEQVEDSLNVDEISELFSSVEQEELSGVDFSVFIEDDDAINVEKISEMCSDLKTCSDDDSVVTVSSPVDVVDTKQLETQTDTAGSLLNFDDFTASQEQEAADAENVTTLSEILCATLEDKNTVDVEAGLALTYSLADYEDAKRVDLVAELFTSLEESSSVDQEAQVADRSATRDWIDALEVDNVSTLFSELEQVEKMQMKTQTEEAPSISKVDSRIFVPKFSVRIEDLQRPGERRPAVGPNSHLLVGPPSAFIAGLPAPSRQERVGRWKSKRKAQPLSAKKPDPTISDTRRASAAKRQRVKGRFVSDTHTFVSITALQN